MLTEERGKEVIKKTVKASILSYSKGKLKRGQKFQILDLIIPKERKIRSVVGGLETSLGTTLWEPLAKALAKENGFEIVKDKLQCPANMPSNLANTLHIIIEERKLPDSNYNALTSHSEIKQACQVFVEGRKIEKFTNPPRGRGVDVWLKKDGINYFFDTKTVQPNIGSLTSYMEEILRWYAYFYSRYPLEKAESRIVFPYNPYKNDFWQKVIGKGFPLEKDNEAWVENQFWNFCSGLPNTYELIQEAFNDLRESKELENDFNTLFK